MPSLANIQTGEKFDVGIGRVLIGRDESQCQVFLNLPFISRVQAVIEVCDDGRAAIKNLSGRDTTFVNGQLVNVCLLNDGDLIEFGFGETIGFSFRKDKPVETDLDPSFSFSSFSVEPVLGDKTVLGHQIQNATTIFRVDLSTTLRIGRAPDNDIILDSPSVSRYHAQLEYSSGTQPEITDLGSTNGVFVNGNLLRSASVLLPTARSKSRVAMTVRANSSEYLALAACAASSISTTC